MEEVTFHHRFPIQLRFFDADQFGHVNNSIFFQYYDTAKMDYLHQACPEMSIHYAIVVVHIEADFLSQVHTDNHVEVQTAVTHIGNKSFTLLQRLVDSDSGEVKCVGKTIMVAYDLEKNESALIPQEWIDGMNKFEGKDLGTTE